MNNQLCSIETLTGNNFKQWKNDVELALGLADIDIALIEDEPLKPTEHSTAEQRAHYQKRERANRLSMQVIKKSISGSFRGSVGGVTTAKGLVEAIG